MIKRFSRLTFSSCRAYDKRLLSKNYSVTTFFATAFSLFENIFPKINKKKIVQYSRRDLEMSFPDFKKKNVYIENWHEDGNLGTCILTTLLPITVFERLDLLSRDWFENGKCHNIKRLFKRKI